MGAASSSTKQKKPSASANSPDASPSPPTLLSSSPPPPRKPNKDVEKIKNKDAFTQCLLLREDSATISIPELEISVTLEPGGAQIPCFCLFYIISTLFVINLYYFSLRKLFLLFSRPHLFSFFFLFAPVPLSPLHDDSLPFSRWKFPHNF